MIWPTTINSKNKTIFTFKFTVTLRVWLGERKIQEVLEKEKVPTAEGGASLVPIDAVLYTKGHMLRWYKSAALLFHRSSASLHPRKTAHSHLRILVLIYFNKRNKDIQSTKMTMQWFIKIYFLFFLFSLFLWGIISSELSFGWRHWPH